MSPHDLEIHKVRRQLLKVVGRLHTARHELAFAVKPINLTHYYSQPCKDAQENLEALRKGLTETISIISKEARRLFAALENRLEKPPPEVGAYLSGGRGKQRLTPFQRYLEREGLATFDTLPKTVRNIKKKPIRIIPFTLVKRKQKPRSKTQLGIPI